MVKVKRIEPPTRMHYRYTEDALEEVPNESYGHKMRRLRLLLGMSQREVAEMVGVADRTISVWEGGLRHGATTEAAELPRRVIALLGQRYRRRLNGGK